MKSVAALFLISTAWPLWALPPAFDASVYVQRAPTLTVFSLHPSDTELVDVHGNRAGPLKDAERFHQFPILGRLASLKKEELVRVRDALVRTLKPIEGDRAPSMCFRPRHAICLEDNGVHLDILLCFECSEAKIVYLTSSESASLRIGITDEAKLALDSLFDEHRIPRDVPVNQKPNKAPEPTPTAVTSPAAQEPRQP